MLQPEMIEVETDPRGNQSFLNSFQVLWFTVTDAKKISSSQPLPCYSQPLSCYVLEDEMCPPCWMLGKSPGKFDQYCWFILLGWAPSPVINEVKTPYK